MICNPGIASILNNKCNSAKRHFFFSDPSTIHLLLSNRLRENCCQGQLTFPRFSVSVGAKNTTLDSLTMPVMVTLYQVSWLMLV